MKKLIFLLVALPLGNAAPTGPVPEKNKAVARRVFDEIFNQGRFQVTNEIYAPDFVNGLRTSAGLKEDQDAAKGWRDAFPDMK